MTDTPTILAIDNNVDLLNRLQLTLKILLGYSVVGVTSGEDALEKFTALQPACVIMDLHLPDFDGLSFIRIVRGDPTTAQTPLIILTEPDAHDETNRLISLASGADFFLTKPVKPLTLLDTIFQAMNISEEQRNSGMIALLMSMQDN